MRKINFFSLFWCVTILGLLFSHTLLAQKKNTKSKKKKVSRVKAVPVLAVSVSGSGSIKTEPYLSLEPCARETTEQISEVENAPDSKKQVEILLKRLDDKDDWLRSCAIYRLGEFRSNAQDALPAIIKLLRNEENRDVWIHVSTALWKIPPAANTPLQERIGLTKDENVYLRIYGVYSLSYFNPPAGSFQVKDTLNALIEAAKDEDLTVRWLAVTGINRLGFYGINTTDAIPVLSELLKSGKINPIHPVDALSSMGANALPAAPLLFDVLYNPEKYVKKDHDSGRAYSLYFSAAMALGSIGKPLLPLLEKEIVKEPFAVLQILGNIHDGDVLPLFFQAMKHENPKVRKKAIDELPTLTSLGAIQTLPYLLTAMRDTDAEVRQSAISKIGTIARHTKEKSDELNEMLRKKAIPALIANLKDNESSCYAAMTLGRFGADAEAAIPHLVRLIKKRNGNICAETGLFDMGEKGKKFLTKEQIEEIEESKKSNEEIFNRKYNKAKPIKPKTQPTPSPTPLKKET